MVNMQRSDLALIAAAAINIPLVMLGIIVLYREISLATIIALPITSIGPLATLGFISKYRKRLKKGVKAPNKYYRIISLIYNPVLVLSILGSYFVHGITEKSLLLLPLIIIAIINTLIVWLPHFFMGEISNAK